MPRSLKPHLFRKEGWGLLFLSRSEFHKQERKGYAGLGSQAVTHYFIRIAIFLSLQRLRASPSMTLEGLTGQ
jgi:hypothetical protein